MRGFALVAPTTFLYWWCGTPMSYLAVTLWTASIVVAIDLIAWALEEDLSEA